MTDNGHSIVIYPEAHIWPKYNKIRNFGSGSFNLPCKFDLPCYAKTTVFKKKKNGKTKQIIYFDGPFYPDMNLPLKEREKDVRDKVYNAMVGRAEYSELDRRYEYIKVDSPEEVRTEIIETARTKRD